MPWALPLRLCMSRGAGLFVRGGRVIKVQSARRRCVRQPLKAAPHRRQCSAPVMASASTAEPVCILPLFLNSQPDLQLTAILINAVTYTTLRLATPSKSFFEISRGCCKCAKVANVRRCKGEDAACQLTRCYVFSTIRMSVGQGPSTLVPASNQAPEALLPMQGRQAGPRLSISSGNVTIVLLGKQGIHACGQRKAYTHVD